MESKFVKSIIFYPMMFMRPFAKIILKLVSIIFLLGAIAGFFGGNFGLALFGFVVCFICFLISWFYDAILLKINPQNTVLILS